MPNLPTRLRELRSRRGWTQAELAVEAGVALSRTHHLERNGAASARVDTLLKLAHALDVSVVALVPGLRDNP